MHRAKLVSRGFTLVELIVIIAVIGILAGVTIVSYNGYQTRTAQNVVQSDLRSVMTAMENARNFGAGYPAAIPSTFQPSQNVSLSYVRGTTSDYCVSGTSTNISGVTYYVEPSVSQSPQAGACPSIVTNLIANPSVEGGSISPNTSYYGAPSSIDSTTGAYGTSSLMIQTNSTSNPQGSIWAASGASPNTVYTCALSIKSTSNVGVSVSGRATQSNNTYIGEGYGQTNVTLTSAWQRVYITFTSPPNAGNIYIQYHLQSPQSGVTIWSDGAMCTTGTTHYQYADGNTNGWGWTGPAQDSSSSGPGV